ncbi:MAG: iron chaperone [Terriglobia bacterium]
MEVLVGLPGMAKVESGNRGSATKGNGAPETVDEYLARVPEPARSTLNKVRAAIRSAVPPEATETISYGIPAFRYKGVLVWFAAFSNHCSLFPTASVVERFKNELKGFSISKGTIRFPTDKPLPAAVVKKLVKARVARNESKQRC